jgi:hypothetical protein
MPVLRRRARAALAAWAAASVLVGATGACTSDTSSTSRPAPPTVDGPSMTTLPEGGGTVTADRLDPPKRAKGELSRIVVRNADGIFWDGSKETRSLTRKGQKYRLSGRCLPTTTGGRLVVEVLGPGGGGAVEGEPSQPVPGPPVAAVTVPCDGNEVTLDLDRLPVSSGELTVAETTSQVSVGWVVLSQVT